MYFKQLISPGEGGNHFMTKKFGKSQKKLFKYAQISMVMLFWWLGAKGWVAQSMSKKGVCRIAPTATGLKKNKGSNSINHGLFWKWQTVNTVATCKYSFWLSIQFHTVKTVADCQGNCRQLQTTNTTADCYRLLQTCLFLSVHWQFYSMSLKGGTMVMACLSGKGSG